MEAAVWCEHEGKRASFRTPALRPDLLEWPTQAQLDAALSVLRTRRRELLGDRRLDRMSPGRLLVCEINESVSSGESEAETLGFFDIDDRPAWDTWVWRLKRDGDQVTLLSWVPQEFEAVVTRGIEVNPYACIYWLTDMHLTGKKHRETVQALVSAGIR